MDKNVFSALECAAFNFTRFSPWHEVHAVASCVKNPPHSTSSHTTNIALMNFKKFVNV
jgi:hypothetical protein